MNALTATFALAERVLPILVEAFDGSATKAEIQQKLREAVDEFADVITGAHGKIVADDKNVLDDLEDFRKGM